MNARRVTRTATIESRKYLLIGALTLGTVCPATDAIGQPEIRFVPLRAAPLGSAPGTIGDPVTPTFNAARDCWEVFVKKGVEVHLDLQAFGWGDAPGDPILGSILATVDPTGYGNGAGGDLLPKGWPGTPNNGIFYGEHECTGNSDPCNLPFDQTCGGGTNGNCMPNPDYIMPPCSFYLSCFATPTLAYGWASAAQALCNVDDGEVKTMGGLILNVPHDAAGTYVVALDPDPNNTVMTSGDGTPIPGLELTSACITTEGLYDNNRYLTFPKGPPNVVAYRLDMVSSLFHPDAFVSGWVGVPDVNNITTLETDPVVRTWDEDVIHITGCEITPAATFELHPMIAGGTFLAPITLQTAAQPGGSKWWGDTVGFFNGAFWTAPQGNVNIDDVVGAIKTFQQADGAPGIFRTDVDPQEPNRIVNINDAYLINLAFQGDLYPFGCANDPCQDNLAMPCP